MMHSQPRASEMSSREVRRKSDHHAGSVPARRSIHANLSYLPAVGLLLALIGDVLYFVSGAQAWIVCSNILIGLSLVASVPVAMLGVVAHRAVEREPQSHRLATVHGIVSVVALVIVSAGWAIRLGAEPTIGSTLLIWSGVGVMLVTCLVGGEIPTGIARPEVTSGLSEERESLGEVTCIQSMTSQANERTAANA